MIFNRVQMKVRMKYFKLVVVEEDPTSKKSETLNISESSIPRDLKRVDDDEETDNSSHGRVYLKRAHYDPSLKRWVSRADIALLPRNVWMLSLLAMFMAISCDAFMYNTAALY